MSYLAGPKQTQQPTVSETTDSSTKVTWPANTDPVDSYEITYTDSTGESKTISVPGTKNFTYITQLKEGEEYTVTVTPVKDGVKGSSSPATKVTTKRKGKSTLVSVDIHSLCTAFPGSNFY